ncbi:HEAT repeat domain-containing protein [Pelagicoccus sp. SDUM812003]|uniref:DUF7133 domain-containing protein n=1 Tax=Pelagicoccus sp. SDUM812003 TaxID=3041267 RepID=UPI00280CDD3D|nr:HEAT repeat domain-containing protein [Pelagicoccus sp. SDUM812003]MDQ8203559.1 HEAT repeat domain-containing protein [Pelagicoccus sp. SDUM812003]
MLIRALPLIAAGCVVSLAFGQKMTLEPSDRLPDPIIDAATAETELAINQLRLPEGIEASLWAAEPLLANPVAFDFDEQGRLFVAETYRYRTSVLDIRGYLDMLEEDMAFRTVDDRARGIIELFGEEQAKQFEIESEVLRLLVDTDGDGRADRSTDYGGKFDSSLSGIASGVLARQGDVYFTNIPHLWKLEGISEDGKALSRESIHRGFGVHFGYTGHDFHGLILGPDGKLYFSIGDRGINVTNHEGETLAYPDQGAVYRCNLDGSELEIVHWGLRNPQELAFDELGNLFTGDNDCDNGDFERLVHIVDGGDSGWRIGHQHAPLGGAGVWMSEGWWKTRFDGRTRFALPPLFYIDDGPSGIAYHPGTGLSPEYQGHLFITHFKGSIASSGVTSYTFEQDGATYKLGEKTDFLEGILPTDVTFAPDGKFYVLDWVDGWPKSNKGRVYALANPETLQDPIIDETRNLISQGMADRDSEELADLLSHPNWNVRLEAQLELASRGEANVPLLSRIAGDPSRDLHARLHATWGLGVLADRDSPKAASEISALAHSETAEVRAQAAKLIGDHRIAGNIDQLVSRLQDASPRVRFFAAQSLGKLQAADAAPALVEAARENDGADAYLEHAIVMGLVGANHRPALQAAIDDDSTAVRMAALLALRRLQDPLVARFLKDPDKEIVLEAARAINDHPIEAAFPALAAAIEHPLMQEPALALRVINAHFRLGDAENAQTMAQLAADADIDTRFRLEALAQLGSWPDPLQRDRIMGVYRPLPKRDALVPAKALATVAPQILGAAPGTVQAAYIETASKLGVTGIADALFALALDEAQDGAARVAAFESLVQQNDPRMDQLVIAASESDASELRLAALPLVARKAPEQAKRTLALMSEGSAQEQRVAFKTLAKTEQPFASELLASSLQRLARNEVPLDAQLELIEAAENHPAPEVRAAYQAYQAAIAADPDPLAPYRFALEGGSSRPEGNDVFFNNQIMACVRCHIVYGPGEAAGPNLSDIGLRLDRRELLEAVVAPNATIAHGYENVILTLGDGSSKFGLVSKEDQKTITLTLPSGEEETFAKSTVVKRDSMPSSMPAVFADNLSRHDLRDVVEFLARQRTDPNARATHGE